MVLRRTGRERAQTAWQGALSAMYRGVPGRKRCGGPQTSSGVESVGKASGVAGWEGAQKQNPLACYLPAWPGGMASVHSLS